MRRQAGVGRKETSMDSQLLSALGALFVVCLSQDNTPKTVPGPEATDLVGRARGVVVITHPVGGIDTVRLPGLEAGAPRKADSELLPAHSVSGPDASGRIAFVENDMIGKRHALGLLSSDGKNDKVFDGEGDALWEHAVGENLALDPRGERIAFVARAKGVQNHAPDAYLMEGELEIWSTSKKERVASGSSAHDDLMAWSPDGKRLLYTAFLAPADAEKVLRKHVTPDDAFGRATLRWAHVPVVHELDLETRSSRAVHCGERPVLSPDGKRLLVRDFELHWRIVDLEKDESRPFEARGAIYPGAIAFVDPETVLYWSWPTEGAAVKTTEHNSPLVGAKQMRALKLVDLGDGRFQTVVPYIDPRRSVSFGPGASEVPSGR
jgi:hypothetical protein